MNDVLAASACVDCGEPDTAVLEFDHVGEKRCEISILVRRGVRIEVLERELERCQIVCANCHRHRTAARARWRRLDFGKSNPWRFKMQERNMLHAYRRLVEAGCVDCRSHDLVVLDFDHIGAKRGLVMRLAHSGVSLARLDAEIAECEVRCANCHRRRHIGPDRRRR